MRASKHTPGPWEACKVGDYGDYDGQCLVVLGDDMRVAVTLGSDKTAKANARLIAAAPDLLDAMRDLTLNIKEAMNTGGWVPSPLRASFWAAVSDAYAAIAKAEGQ